MDNNWRKRAIERRTAEILSNFSQDTDVAESNKKLLEKLNAEFSAIVIAEKGTKI